MKISSKVVSVVGTLAFHSSPVLAAATAREDSSNVLVWAFLGICALIIFLQMVPVFSIAYGLVKGVFGKKDGLEEELEAAASKYQ